MSYKFKSGDYIKIVGSNHPHCGEFATVKQILSDGFRASVLLASNNEETKVSIHHLEKFSHEDT